MADPGALNIGFASGRDSQTMGEGLFYYPPPIVI